MFDYTQATIHQIISELKFAISIVGKITKIATIVYSIYAIFAPSGYLFANIILGAFALAHFIFELVVENRTDKKTKQAKTLMARIHTWCKIGVKAITLGLTFYSLYFTMVDPSLISLVLAGLMAIGWVLQVFIEIIKYIVEGKVELLIASWHADTKGVTEVGNFFKKLKGDEVVDTSISERTMEKLNQNMVSWQAYKAEQKAQKKLIKQQNRAQQKAKKAAEKLAKQKEKEQQTQSKTRSA